MPRYRLTVEYDGTGFVGWQRQDSGPSIQAALEGAALAFCGHPTRMMGSGRTDAGVHARGQVCHFDLPAKREPDVIRGALNAHLRPALIAVIDAAQVADDFDARRDANARTYLYRIINRPAPLALDYGHAWFCPKPLDATLMAEGATRLLGHHDFTTFRAAECQAKTPMKTLDQLDVKRVGDEIHVIGKARSFLHNQMRAIVGTLALVGRSHWTPDDVSHALDAKDRQKGGPNAPPGGLYLMKIDY